MKVTMTDNVWQRMKAYVDLCPDEISGLGKVEKVVGGFRIVDIALFEQVVSATHSDITAQALAKFQVELIRKGESLEDWNFWWHSHATMATFFSGTDTATIDSSTEFKYMVSLVTNHKHEFTARVDIYEPVRMFMELDVEIEEEENVEVREACQEEIDAKVTRPIAKSVKSTFSWKNDENVHDGMGFKQRTILPVTRSVSNPSIDELETALGMYGSDDYAQAIDVYESMVDDLIEAIELCPNRKERKKLKKDLKRLEALGEEHSLADDSDTD